MLKCLCYTSIYCGVLTVLIDGRSSRFPCDVIGYKLARRGAWRGAAKASGSGGIQRLWVW